MSSKIDVLETGTEMVGPAPDRRTVMTSYFAGIDVSLEESSVCVVNADCKIVREVKVASDPEALARVFREARFAVSRIGLEARSL